MHVESEDAYVTCDFCNRIFVAKSLLLVHMRLHHIFDQKICQLCEKKFQNAKRLAIHMRRHVETRKYECDICGKNYAHKAALSMHMEDQHVPDGGTEKSNICDKCGKMFKARKSYRSHVYSKYCVKRGRKMLLN